MRRNDADTEKPKKQFTASTSHHNTRNLKDEKPLEMRSYLRRISPSFMSSFANPLVDAYQQVELMSGKR
jgi:hypothetical protein